MLVVDDNPANRKVAEAMLKAAGCAVLTANNGKDGFEGAVTKHAIGTYLHGPLLPKNPWLADLLIAWALEYATGSRPVLEPLDDHLEEAAHAAAIVRTRQPNR